MSLLTTKLYVPPPQPNLVPRPRLMQRLEGGLHQGHKLTLVSAPAGFGKTTLLSAWVAERREQVAWLSLDADDNEPPRFWTYLITALQTVRGGVGADAAPALGQEALQLLQVPNPPSIETILTRLLNEIAALPDEVLLVLDDYHLISTPAIQEGLTFLLTHHPPPLHLVISTRADPPLPIVRLRARGCSYCECSLQQPSNHAIIELSTTKDFPFFLKKAGRNKIWCQPLDEILVFRLLDHISYFFVISCIVLLFRVPISFNY